MIQSWCKVATSAWLMSGVLVSCAGPTKANIASPTGSTSPDVAVSQGSALPSGGTPILGNDVMTKLNLVGQTEKGKLTRVKVEGMPFTEAIQLETVTQPKNYWELQLGSQATEAVKQGDVVHLRFWVRALKGQAETGEGKVLAGFTTTGPEWAPNVTLAVGAGKQWQLVDLPFTVRHTRAENASQLVFSIGYSPQIVQIAGVSILNYGNKLAMKDLPKTSTRYKGDEPDAAWRKEAEARIDKIRKGDLTLSVVDSSGKPIPGARVSLNMTRHAFHFGTAVASDLLVSNTPDAQKYKEVLKQNFNFAAIENHLKWPFWETWAKADAGPSLKWLADNNFPIRGHNVVWPGWSNLPEDLPKLANDKVAMRKRINDHIKEIMLATKGQIHEWDVVNETFTNHDLMDILGADEIISWFKQTHQWDPKPRLTLNDYPALDGAGVTDQHLNHFYSQIERLQKGGAPIQAIGFQCHFGSSVVPPERVLSGLDRFSKFGLPIVITEFDMDTQDMDLKARYMRDFMTAAFSHPSIANITQWGFWEGKHWMPNAALFTKDWQLNPHGKVYRDLVYGKWWTKASGETNAKGEFSQRAFFGDYQVTVEVNGKQIVSKMVSFPNAASGRIVIKG